MAEELNILTDAVSDIDGTQIAAAGTAVSKAVLAEVAENGLRGAGKVSVGDAGIAGDFAAVFEDPDLSVFLDDDLRDRILGVVESIALPEAVYRELEDMRVHSPLLYAHSVATAVLSTRVVLEIVMKKEDLIKIATAVLLKDLGMTRVAKPLTKNQDYLTKQQFHQIRKHPVIGMLLITHYLGEGIEGMVALRHHMRNGAGYPKWGGLKPSKLVDILEVVDVFYALISPRPFRPDPFDTRGAIDELSVMAGNGQILEDGVKMLVMAMREDRPDLGEVNLSEERLGFVPESNFYGTGPSN